MMNSFSVIFFFIFKYSFAGYRILGCCFFGGGVGLALSQNFGHISPSSFSSKERNHPIVSSIPSAVETVLRIIVKLVSSSIIQNCPHLEYIMSYQCSDTGDRQRSLRKPPEKTENLCQTGSNSFPSQEKLGIGFSIAFHTELWKGIWQVSAPKLCSPQSPIQYSLLSVLKLRKQSFRQPLHKSECQTHVSVFSFPPQEEAGSWEFFPDGVIFKRGKN